MASVVRSGSQCARVKRQGHVPFERSGPHVRPSLNAKATKTAKVRKGRVVDASIPTTQRSSQVTVGSPTSAWARDHGPGSSSSIPFCSDLGGLGGLGD